MLVTVLYVGEITNIQFQTFSPTFMFFANIHFSPTLKQSKNNENACSKIRMEYLPEQHTGFADS